MTSWCTWGSFMHASMFYLLFTVPSFIISIYFRNISFVHHISFHIFFSLFIFTLRVQTRLQFFISCSLLVSFFFFFFLLIDNNIYYISLPFLQIFIEERLFLYMYLIFISFGCTTYIHGFHLHFFFLYWTARLFFFKIVFLTLYKFLVTVKQYVFLPFFVYFIIFHHVLRPISVSCPLLK